ncbi:hypothetical protein B0T24DRAFT_270936 [Lasiosphaeria ovina]|uniref:Uncharacterized protein n=1 Tax=Lasiosphaeria ovina TaxID=92902 RepID=A0AAE0N861_9PEZI|nr:hypothetical protein B0T24DRAFT_270936 [Lasiosphaeria ovina]
MCRLWRSTHTPLAVVVVLLNATLELHDTLLATILLYFPSHSHSSTKPHRDQTALLGTPNQPTVVRRSFPQAFLLRTPDSSVSPCFCNDIACVPRTPWPNPNSQSSLARRH